MIDSQNSAREGDSIPPHRAAMGESPVASQDASLVATVDPGTRSRRAAGFAVGLAIVGGLGLFFFTSRGESIDSLAVLPFENVTRNPEVEFLSDGIAQSIVDRLSPYLEVASFSSALQLKEPDPDPAKAARTLGVRAVLTGEIFRRGDDLNVKAKLTDTMNGVHIWGMRHSGHIDEIFNVEDEIAREVVRALRLKLTGEEEERLNRRATENTEAYLLYLEGRSFLNEGTHEGADRAIELFNRALEVDPNYGTAQEALAGRRQSSD